jgi:hypothetical protein
MSTRRPHPPRGNNNSKFEYTGAALNGRFLKLQYINHFFYIFYIRSFLTGQVFEDSIYLTMLKAGAGGIANIYLNVTPIQVAVICTGRI